jgi:4-hydroxythreonine-4-phosphate dehydrogenase
VADEHRARNRSHALPRIAITTGEPAGIGPEISLEAARAARIAGTVRAILIGDGRMLASRARAANIPIALVAYAADAEPADGAIEVVDVPLAAACVPGRLDAANGRYVLSVIDRGIDGAASGAFDALVTAPVQKSVINDAGIAFTGHTEYLAHRTSTARVVMMLAGAITSSASKATMLRVALATTHLALKDVPHAVTREGLLATLRIIDADLRDKFGIAAPRILVTGLNPHAGEGGYLGCEEIEVIAPAIERVRAEGIDARGPLPADTLFQPRYLDDCDAVLAMYHDQGLPVLKYATFGHGVNITLGLPIVRTSVDHGTALDLAGRPDAMRVIDAGSMRIAIDVAATMAASIAAGSAGPRRTHPHTAA